jgi:8-oxo-dGTP diphosphatase
VKEEVGLTVEVVRRLGDRVHPATGRHLMYLVCRIVAGDPTVVDQEEVTAIEWCNLRTVLERWSGLTGGIRHAVREYLEQSLATNDADNSGTASPLA